MSDFTDISSFVASQRDRFQEMVRDQFGASIIEDVFEPILGESKTLDSLNENIAKTSFETDQIIAEARGLGGIQSS
jgi:hypothetical protein